MMLGILWFYTNLMLYAVIVLRADLERSIAPWDEE